MAHFAKIEDGVVTNVVVVDDANENNGQEYLNGLGLDGIWIQTSYNSNFRGKFATVGDTYDEIDDIFVSESPFDSWVLDKTTARWNAPVEYPTDGGAYYWNEETLSWNALEV